MTRTRLLEITAAQGLTLDLERVTTGLPEGAAFREFEFTHTSWENLETAAKQIRAEWGVRHDFCAVRSSAIDGKPYLLVSSFWCEAQVKP